MLTKTAGLLKRRVYPSGADLATYSFAMLVPAPGRFSTITCWGRSSESFDASTRALMSTPPPGVNPTMRRSEEHTSELQSHSDLVCRLLRDKKKVTKPMRTQLQTSIHLTELALSAIRGPSTR